MDTQEEIPVEVKQYTQEEFVEMFNELCKKTGWTVAAIPELKHVRDGEFVTIAKLIVVKVEQK